MIAFTISLMHLPLPLQVMAGGLSHILSSFVQHGALRELNWSKQVPELASVPSSSLASSLASCIIRMHGNVISEGKLDTKACFDMDTY